MFCHRPMPLPVTRAVCCISSDTHIYVHTFHVAVLFLLCFVIRRL